MDREERRKEERGEGEALLSVYFFFQCWRKVLSAGRGSKAGSVFYRICVSVELRVVRSNALPRTVVVHFINLRSTTSILLRSFEEFKISSLLPFPLGSLPSIEIIL